MQIVQSNDEAAAVQLRIRHINRDAELNHNALSYAWGTVTPAYRVITDEHGIEGLFEVRKNLYEFFQAARRPSACYVFSTLDLRVDMDRPDLH